MDELGERNEIIGNLERLIAFNKESKGSASQNSLFGSIGGIEIKLSLIPQEKATSAEKLIWEKELLGLYISGHPLDAYKEKIQKFGTEISKVKNDIKVGNYIYSEYYDEISEVTQVFDDFVYAIRVGMKNVDFPERNVLKTTFDKITYFEENLEKLNVLINAKKYNL